MLPIQTGRHYVVDVFYDNERPKRPFAPIQDLQLQGEMPVLAGQSVNRRMVRRGNDMEQKHVLLSRMTLQAKKLGADALVTVKYTYYTSQTDNGYVLSGLAVRYKKEVE